MPPENNYYNEVILNDPTLTVSNPVEAQRDHLTNPNDLYVSQSARARRWSAFEEHLRQNRVDITSSWHSCGTARDRVA